MQIRAREGSTVTNIPQIFPGTPWRSCRVHSTCDPVLHYCSFHLITTCQSFWQPYMIMPFPFQAHYQSVSESLASTCFAYCILFYRSALLTLPGWTATSSSNRIRKDSQLQATSLNTIFQRKLSFLIGLWTPDQGWTRYDKIRHNEMAEIDR